MSRRKKGLRFFLFLLLVFALVFFFRKTLLMGYARLFDVQTASKGRMPWFAFRAARPPGCPKRSGFGITVMPSIYLTDSKKANREFSNLKEQLGFCP